MFRLFSIPVLAIGIFVFFTAQPFAEEQGQSIQVKVFKSPGWGCCGGWIKHLEDGGLIIKAEDTNKVSEIKARHNIPVHLQSCHTAIVDGYVIEGHVPRDEIIRLLREKPDIVGLSVPGMPLGSPGMEMADGTSVPYEVISFDKLGKTGVFATYPKSDMTKPDREK